MATKGMKKARIKEGNDKGSHKDRIQRGKAVGTMATKTVAYQTDPAFKSAVDSLVQRGVELADAEDDVNKFAVMLANAKAIRDTKRGDYDKAYGVCAASVENHSSTPEDVQSYGFDPLQMSIHTLAGPTDLKARYDGTTQLIHAHVIRAPGSRSQCALEISPVPVGPGTFVRLDGNGARRTLSGYAPGTYAIRAATVDGKNQSVWFGPVQVIVK